MSKLFGTTDYESGSRLATGQTAQGIKQVGEYTERALGEIAPYRKAGTEALDLFKNIVLGGDMSQFYKSPSYQFTLEEGLKGLESTAAAQGNTLSGAQLKAAEEYAQNLASQELQNYLANIGGLASQGFGAAQAAGSYLTGAGANIGSLYGSLGQTQAQMMAGKGAAKAGLFGELIPDITFK